MKKQIISALLGALLVPAALAQQTNWSGPYAGGHLGYGFGESRADLSLGGSWGDELAQLRSEVVNGWSRDLKPSSPSVGVQAGYNFQVSNNFVFGGELDYSVLDMNSASNRSFTTNTFSIRYAVRNEIDVKDMLSLRAKAGFAYNQTLFYVTAGWAWSRTEMDAEVLSSGNYSKAGRASRTLDGYTVGAGVEHRLSRQLSVRADYKYADLGKTDYATAYRAGSAFAPPGQNYQESVRQDLQVHLFNIGLNYHF